MLTAEFLSQEAAHFATLSTRRLCRLWEHFMGVFSAESIMAACRISDELERRNHAEFMAWQAAGDEGDASYMTPSIFFTATPAAEGKI